MNTQTSTQSSPPAAAWPDGEGFLAGLCAGRFRWDVLHPFPRQDTDDRRAGDAALAELAKWKSLKYLDVQEDPVTDKGLAELRKARSGIKILSGGIPPAPLAPYNRSQSFPTPGGAPGDLGGLTLCGLAVGQHRFEGVVGPDPGDALRRDADCSAELCGHLRG